jgi:hypothetical protein
MYLVVKGAGLLDSLWALIVLTMVSAFNVIVLRAFFSSLPNEITESARIDGAGELKTFSYIVLPLSKAVLSVIGLFYAVGYWNAFFGALLYLNDSKLWPLQLVLRTYVISDTQLGSAELGTELLPPQAAIQMAILVTPGRVRKTNLRWAGRIPGGVRGTSTIFDRARLSRRRRCEQWCTAVPTGSGWKRKRFRPSSTPTTRSSG